MLIEEIIAAQVELQLTPKFTALADAIAAVSGKVDGIDTASIMTKLLELEALLQDIQVHLTTDSCDGGHSGDIQEVLDKQAAVIAALKEIGATLVALGGDTPVDPIPTEQHPLIGLNIAGMSNNPAFQPGQLGTHYRTPAPRGNQPDYFTMYGSHAQPLVEGQQHNWLIRVPYALERAGVVSGGVVSLLPDYMDELREILDLAATHKVGVLMDMHAYCRCYVSRASFADPDSLPFKRTTQTVNGVTVDCLWVPIGHALCPWNYSLLAELYGLLAAEFKDHPALWGWGLMNEPHNAGAPDGGINVDEDWIDNCDSLRAAIRAAGDDHWVTIAGCAFSTAKNWVNESGRLLETVDLTDEKIMFEAHQYCDQNGGGGGRWDKSLVHVVDPVARANDWDNAINWANTNGVKLVAGEFGGPVEFEKWTAASGGTFEYTYTVQGMEQYFVNLYNKFAANNIPSFQWLAGPGKADSYANGMDRDDGSLKPNAAELSARIGTLVAHYGN
jgi:endoglucanase